MFYSTITSKNQTALPKEVVEALKLRPLDRIIYDIRADGRVILSAKNETFASVAASLPKMAKPDPAPTIEDMDVAIEEMAGKHLSRSV